MQTRNDQLDRALEMTFPASDPIAISSPTSTEPVQAWREAQPSEPTPEERASLPAAMRPWLEMWVRPWAMWTAVGLMMMRGWPLRGGTPPTDGNSGKK